MGIGMLLRALACLCIMAWPAAAHEFWIEPHAYRADVGAPVTASLFVGQDFKGREQSYLPRNFKSFTMTDASGTSSVQMTLGDRPAFVQTPTQEGAFLLGYVSNPMRVIYNEVEKFQTFIQEKDFAWAWDAHQQRGLSTDRIIETYHRYAKAMVQVGGIPVQDVDLGYEIEFIAQSDLSKAGEAVFLLEYQDAPLPKTQVTVWDKASDGTVTHHTYRTDAGGIVHVPTQAGRSYLVDAVVIRPLAQSSSKLDPMWETVWASYTFGAR